MTTMMQKRIVLLVSVFFLFACLRSFGVEFGIPAPPNSKVVAYSAFQSPEKHCYFIQGVDLPVEFYGYGDLVPVDPTCDCSEEYYEQHAFFDHLEWRINNGAWFYDHTSSGIITINVGSQLGVGGSLWVRQVDTWGRASGATRVNFDVIAPPPSINAEDLLVAIGQPNEKGEKSLSYSGTKSLSVGVLRTTDIDGIPILGNERFNFGINISPEIKINSQGYARHRKISLGRGESPEIPDFETWDIGFFKMKPKLDLRNNWKYRHLSSQWEPGGTLDVGLSVEVISFSRHWLLGYVPVFVKGDASVGGGGTFDFLGVNPGGSAMELYGSANLTGELSLYTGVGLAGILSAGVSGKGTITGTFYADNEPIEATGAQINITASVRAEAFYWSAEEELHQWNWSLSSNVVGRLSTAMIEQMKAPAGAFNKLSERASVAIRAEENVGSIASFQSQAPSAYSENVYKHPTPKLLSRSQDSLLTWVRDNPARASQNRTELVLQRKVNGNWSQPQPVNDNGSPDFCPQVVSVANGAALLVWQDTNTSLNANATLGDALPHQEIKVAQIDSIGTITAVTSITSNDFLDGRPQLSSAVDGTAVLIWIANPGNSLFGDQAHPNTLMCSNWSGSGWSAPEIIASGLGAVTEMSVANTANLAEVLFVADLDNDLSTDSDRELFSISRQGASWGQPVRRTTDSLPQGSPVVGFTETQELIVAWLEQGQPKFDRTVELNNSSPIAPTFQEPVNSMVAVQQNGVFSGVTWLADTSDFSTRLISIKYDSATQSWQGAIDVPLGESTKREVTASLSSTDVLTVAYAQDTLGDDANGLKTITHTDLVVTDCQPGFDLAVEELGSINAPNLSGETVQLYTRIANLGFLAAPTADISFYAGNPNAGGELITTKVVTALSPGASLTVTHDWLPDSDANSHVYAVVSVQTPATDLDASNNSRSAELLTSEVTISDISFDDQSRLLSVNVINEGLLATDPNLVMSVHEGTPTGALLGSQTVPTVLPGTVSVIEFQIALEPTASAPTRELVLLLEKSSGGNSASVVDEAEMTIASSLDSDQDGVADEIERRQGRNPLSTDLGTGYNGTWVTGGSNPWRAQSVIAIAKGDSAEVTGLPAGQVSSLSCTVTGAVLSFRWSSRDLTSPEGTPKAFVRLLVDGQEVAKLEGLDQPDWKDVSVPLAPGAHVLTWEFHNSITDVPEALSNAAWLDEVMVLAVAPVASMPSVNSSGEAFQFQFSGEVGRTYMLQRSANLVNWITIKRDIPGAASPTTIIDQEAAGSNRFFYRVAVQE